MTNISSYGVTINIETSDIEFNTLKYLINTNINNSTDNGDQEQLWLNPISSKTPNDYLDSN